MKLIKLIWREVLIGVLLIVVFSSVRQCKVKEDDNAVLINVNDSLFNTAKYYVTKAGKLEGQVKTHELTIQQWKKYGDRLGFEIEGLKKQVGNSNRLVAHWKGKVESKSEVFKIALKDTSLTELDNSFDLESETISEGKAFEWSNKYLSLDGLISLDKNELAIKYQYQTEFSITAYYKPQGLFKRSQLVTDIWFEDPNMKVQEFKGFLIKEPRKKFYQMGWFKVSVGVGLGYGLSKIF